MYAYYGADELLVSHPPGLQRNPDPTKRPERGGAGWPPITGPIRSGRVVKRPLPARYFSDHPAGFAGQVLRAGVINMQAERPGSRRGLAWPSENGLTRVASGGSQALGRVSGDSHRMAWGITTVPSAEMTTALTPGITIAL